MKSINKLSFIIPVLCLALLSSCSKDEDFRTRNIEIAELQEYIVENQITTQPTWTGLYYMETEAGTGISAFIYDTVYFYYSLSDLSGSIITSSSDLTEPAYYILGSTNVIHGWNEAFCYMKAGGKARIIVPSTIGYGAQQFDNLDPYTTLISELELVDVKPGIAVEEFNTDGLTEMTTESGLKYYAVEQNTRIMVKPGNLVTVNYTGYLENGKIFDSSVKRGVPAEFDLLEGNLISGFIEGLLLMKVGEKFRFTIPASLGYGSEGRFPIIPPNQNIIFDVEVTEII